MQAKTLAEKGNLVAETFPIGGYACNCTVLYSKKSREAIVVDPGNDAKSLLAYLAEKQLKPVKLVHTHAHFDHIGQSGAVHKATGATLHLHKGDLFLYEALAQQGMFFGQQVGEIVPLHGHIQDEETYGLSDPELLDFMKAMHTPGHTPGSCCFYTEHFDTPLLLAGDTLFRQSIGRTDLPGGDFDTIVKSIKERVYALPGDTFVITGHGPSTTIHGEKKGNPFVRA
jgi:hydroxyacylglutathione hydrolase